MTRIYFDSNIFRYLKSNEGNKYSLLQENLFDSKNQLLFYYSYAHLSDLGRDKTDRKFDDLLFMEQFVDKNFLNLNRDEEIVNVQIASPIDSFNSMDFTPLNETLDFDKLAVEIEVQEGDTDEVKTAKKLAHQFFNMPLSNLGISNLPEMPEGNNPIAKLLPIVNERDTLLDLMKGMMGTFHDLYEDPSIWRDFRNYSIQSLGNKKFDIDINNESFNELLRDTPLQKSFLEFVEDTFTHNKSLEKQRQFNFFINAYNCLNLLGLDNEKNKKVVFSSFQNDAQHAYYAAHCDYLVSADEQLLLKAKVLYKLFNIETKVLNLREFEEELLELETGDMTADNFVNYLTEVFENAELQEDSEIEVNKRLLTYKLKVSFFHYFNHLNLVIENRDSPMYIFYNNVKNYSRFTSFIEFEKITNKIISILGIDSNGKMEFTDSEKKEIIENNWDGRIWHFEEETFCLQIEPCDYRLCFYYLPKFKI